MDLKVTQKLSNRQTVELTFDGSDLQDVILKAGAVLSFDGKCAFCEAEEFTLQTRLAGEHREFKYTEYVCNKCGATRQFGEYRDGSGMWLKEWKEAYNRNNESSV